MNDNELTTLPLMLCVEDLMPILSIGRNRAYKMVRNGEIPSVRIGRLYRIPRSAVVSFIKGKTNEAVSL